MKLPPLMLFVPCRVRLRTLPPYKRIAAPLPLLTSILTSLIVTLAETPLDISILSLVTVPVPSMEISLSLKTVSLLPA